MATVINNAMLEAILAEIRPLIGRGKVAGLYSGAGQRQRRQAWYRDRRWTVALCRWRCP
ncbi:hypothetical protein MJ561_14495 [Klebsiella pneumoniae]|nr:hypothetical protein MJ561_14495 [Klebsiella pneumoniae]